MILLEETCMGFFKTLFSSKSSQPTITTVNGSCIIYGVKNVNKNNSLKGQEKILELCKILKADTYYNAIGGKELYDKKEFEDNGISLHFLKTDENLRYKQFLNMEFVPNLSIIDVLMFNSVEEVNKMLDDYFLE